MLSPPSWLLEPRVVDAVTSSQSNAMALSRGEPLHVLSTISNADGSSALLGCAS